ncbi:hypothetical protein Moror_13085 [Moniliophthora roreri MCA 2997]|uniref:Uncharacterized protein n=2 Tax=Moniliophthora roreri TaxID=221103 RepID=V2XMV4_MONRO|nr:hypothetical protein Moror_13085 [Moniliophthora roreri MCA 2997]
MSYDFQPASYYYNFPSSSTMILEQLSPALSPSSSPTSTITSSPSYSTLMNVLNTSSYFTSPPSGAAVPLSPPDAQHARRRSNSGSFGERRGYSYTIAFEPTKPMGQVTAAKGDLEPRAGALPRRTRKKGAPAPPKVIESKGFDLLVGLGSSRIDSDDDE